MISKTKYFKRSTHVFHLHEPGNYRIKCYTKNLDGRVKSSFSAPFRFDGFRPKAAPKNVVRLSIAGVSRTSAAAKRILEKEYEVESFVSEDAAYVGRDFFGTRIVGPHELEGVSLLVANEDEHSALPATNFYSFRSGRDDIVNRVLHSLGAMNLYRLSRELYLEGLLEGAYFVQNFIFVKYNSRVPFKARIGDGTRLGIGGIGAVIHPDSVIGKNCVIGQNVTLGSRANGNGTPVLGDNVWISPGAKCFGGKIGSNVIIGANAVVLNEVPDNAIVAGVPARIISRDISKYSGYFRKMNDA